VIEIGQHFAVGPECRIKISIDCWHRSSTDYKGQCYCRRTDRVEASVESARFKPAHCIESLCLFPRSHNARVRFQAEYRNDPVTNPKWPWKVGTLPVIASRATKLGATVATVGFPNIGFTRLRPEAATRRNRFPGGPHDNRAPSPIRSAMRLRRAAPLRERAKT
jgi:hypothetical protein